MTEIPVYLFAGFLESGKTTFIQETLEDPEFNDGEDVLVVVCEEGMEEYEPEKYPGKNVHFLYFDSPESMTKVAMHKAQREHNCSRIIIEYNGMWMLDDLLAVMPKSWLVYQLTTFADANTFESYNANMRQLAYDKLVGASLVVFNRCKDGFDKMPLHKIVRAVSRMTAIIYEYEDGTIENDDIEDPLPYDLEADVVTIEDKDFAWFYSDIMENGEKYYGKTLKFKGFVKNNVKLPEKTFLFGRKVMTCCEDDIGTCAFMMVSKNAGKVKNGQWLTIKCKVNPEIFDAVGNDLKILQVLSMEKAEKPQPEVASFM